MRIDSILKRAVNTCTTAMSKLKKINEMTTKLKSCVESAYSRDYNANLVCNLAYAGAVVVFLIGSLSPRPPKVPFPITGNMFPTKAKFGKVKLPRTVLTVLFCFHFMRRVLEVLFIHKFKRDFRLSESLIGPVLYWIFALWISVSIRPAAGYINTNIVVYVAGTILVILGEMCCAWCYIRCALDYKLCSLFKKCIPSYELPGGFLYSYNSCPHLITELLSWLGYFIASGTLSTFLFFLCNLGVVALIFILRRYRKHTKPPIDVVANGNTIYV